MYGWLNWSARICAHPLGKLAAVASDIQHYIGYGLGATGEDVTIVNFALANAAAMRHEDFAAGHFAFAGAADALRARGGQANAVVARGVEDGAARVALEFGIALAEVDGEGAVFFGFAFAGDYCNCWLVGVFDFGGGGEGEAFFVVTVKVEVVGFEDGDYVLHVRGWAAAEYFALLEIRD